MTTHHITSHPCVFSHFFAKHNNQSRRQNSRTSLQHSTPDFRPDRHRILRAPNNTKYTTIYCASSTKAFLHTLYIQVAFVPAPAKSSRQTVRNIRIQQFTLLHTNGFVVPIPTMHRNLRAPNRTKRTTFIQMAFVPTVHHVFGRQAVQKHTSIYCTKSFLYTNDRSSVSICK